MAGESCVLLKNEKILPLSVKKKVIWAGPYTASREFLSRWSIFGEHESVETIEEVLQKKQIEAECITGCNILSDEECKVCQTLPVPPAILYTLHQKEYYRMQYSF